MQEVWAQVIECKTKTLNPSKQIVKAIFGWDYNTWWKCYYCGEF